MVWIQHNFRLIINALTMRLSMDYLIVLSSFSIFGILFVEIEIIEYKMKKKKVKVNFRPTSHIPLCG